MLVVTTLYALTVCEGFRTPGPNLWVDSERGPKHFIATNLKQKEADTIGPGR